MPYHTILLRLCSSRKQNLLQEVFSGFYFCLVIFFVWCSVYTTILSPNYIKISLLIIYLHHYNVFNTPLYSQGQKQCPADSQSSIYFFLLNRFFFQRSFSSIAKLSRKYKKIPIKPMLSHSHSLLHYQLSEPRWYIYYNH